MTGREPLPWGGCILANALRAVTGETKTCSRYVEKEIKDVTFNNIGGEKKVAIQEANVSDIATRMTLVKFKRSKTVEANIAPLLLPDH